MPGRVAGKVVIVTGAANGIGRGCAELLAEEGAQVVVADIQKDAGEAATRTIQQAGGDALFQKTDVTKEDDCKQLVERAVERYGQLDGLVNNVGWFPRATLEKTTTELWEQVMAVNLRGAFYCCKYAIPEIQKQSGGSVVNIGSVNGIQGLPELVAYSSAKGGLLTLTRTLAGAYARDKIRVNYVLPGWVLTETELKIQAAAGRDAEDLQRLGEALPLGRHQTPRDTAYAVLYLISDESSQVTGTAMHIDAGASSLPVLPQSY
jgi:NAD(P)-dependent dehydrogenase (short-subunit alcohol dehydrogenase family)